MVGPFHEMNAQPAAGTEPIHGLSPLVAQQLPARIVGREYKLQMRSRVYRAQELGWKVVTQRNAHEPRDREQRLASYRLCVAREHMRELNEIHTPTEQLHPG